MPVGPRPALSAPGLARPRAQLLTAVSRAAGSHPADLAAGLKLPPSVKDEALAANRRARTAPTLPALDRYAGVLYASLGAGSLTPAARRRAGETLLIFSGLWGVVRASDWVPAYRVPAAGSVPGLGSVLQHWRGPLAEVLPDVLGNEPVLDLRSSDYRALWRPTGRLAAHVVPVRILADRGGGATSPVSHHAKTVKGELARFLLTSRRRFGEPVVAVRAAAEALDLRVTEQKTRDGWQVDLVGHVRSVS